MLNKDSFQNPNYDPANKRRKHKHYKKKTVRRAVKAVVLSQNKKTGNYYLSDRPEWFQISINTKLQLKGREATKFKGTMVPVGNIVYVGTNYGWKPAIVIENFKAIGDAPMKMIKKMRIARRVTNRSVKEFAPYLVDAFEMKFKKL